MLTISTDQLLHIYNTACSGNKIAAIKLLREATADGICGGGAMSLGEAKRIVELVSNTNKLDGSAPAFDTILSLLSVVRLSQTPAAAGATVKSIIGEKMQDPELAIIDRIISELDKLPSTKARASALRYLNSRYCD